MKKVEFNKNGKKEVEVLVNEETYGALKLDTNQNAWVLWPEQIDDGITYFEDLKETEKTITDEIQSYEEEEE